MSQKEENLKQNKIQKDNAGRMRITTYGDQKWGDCSMGRMEPSVDIIQALGCVDSKRGVVRRQENFRHQAMREDPECPVHHVISRTSQTKLQQLTLMKYFRYINTMTTEPLHEPSTFYYNLVLGCYL